MKASLKVFAYLSILTFLHFAFRKGLLPIPIPIPLPQDFIMLIFFSLFTLLAWFVTKRFAKSDEKSLEDLGISFKAKNRMEFLYGFFVGVVLWGIVSFAQSFLAGFSWVVRPDISVFNVVYGLLFIFIADLGTELYFRGYPLTKLKDSFGSSAAIVVMVFFSGLLSFSIEAEPEILFYSMIIPALHTLFFSIIYFKTKRLGAAVGLHTGANFITISIFDLRIEQPNQAIPAGIFQSDVDIETLSLFEVQLPWVLMALALSIVVYFWWKKKPAEEAI
jgi:membrane protease YdiL (CAAX protease family)